MHIFTIEIPSKVPVVHQKSMAIEVTDGKKKRFSAVGIYIAFVGLSCIEEIQTI
jgi:hypothetical protein